MSHHRSSYAAALCLIAIIEVSSFLPAYSSGWKLVFEDNFDGNSLDRRKWATRFIYADETTDSLNDELQHYRDNANHIIDSGQLELVAKQVGANLYESGMIRSIQTFYYGYFEARVFLPKGRGIWPAFWLNSDYDQDGKLTWPPEIDIFEYVVNGKENTDNMIHSAASNAAQGFRYRNPKFDLRWRNYKADGPLNDAWHVFGLVWTPETISVFLDGQLLYTQDYKWLKSDGTLGAPAHILLNFAVGGQWAGRHGVDETNFPQSLKVDYVRVCQFTKQAIGTKLCGVSEMTPDPGTYGYETDFNDLEKPSLGDAVITMQGAAVNGSIRPGTILTIDPQITFPQRTLGRRYLALALRNFHTNQEIASSTQISAIVASSPSGVSSHLIYTIPKSIPEGDYYLTAQLLYQDDTPGRSTQSNRTPLHCESDFDKIVKALSCNIAKLKLGSGLN